MAKLNVGAGSTVVLPYLGSYCLASCQQLLAVMNETSSWEPPTGRAPVRVGATMLHYLGLGPEPTEDYYAFKCELTT